MSTDKTPRIPSQYLTATWRNTTPVDDAFTEIGVGFNLEEGNVLRLRLDVSHARALAESIADYLRDHDARVHVDVSTPEG